MYTYEVRINDERIANVQNFIVAVTIVSNEIGQDITKNKKGLNITFSDNKQRMYVEDITNSVMYSIITKEWE